ncbi:MAG: NAD(P)/FAD-dependent oxidoreductase [Pyrinomonadaceae bacterium]
MNKKKADHDVMVIGGGPGGLSAALWCAELGLDVILLEKETNLGGQLLRVYGEIKNYLGAEAASGVELRDVFLRQIKAKDVVLRTGVEIAAIRLAEKKIILAGGEAITGKAIIIATGVRRRKLDIPGEDEFCGRGILESGVKARKDVAGKRVLIVGGGDAALENALILADEAEKIYVVHRRSNFTAREEFLDGMRNNKKIEPILNSRVTGIFGNEAVEAAEIEDIGSGSTRRIDIDAVLIRIGVQPNTELFRGQVDLDDAGYICIDSNCSTSVEGVFAIGDVASPFSPTIATAAGQGATAAKVIGVQLNR